MLLFTIALFAASAAIEPARDMPVIDPAPQGALCPETADVASPEDGQAAAESHSAQRASAGADVHGRGPPRRWMPGTDDDDRVSGRRPALIRSASTQPKGDRPCLVELTLVVRDCRLRDLLRHLSLSDRVCRDFRSIGPTVDAGPAAPTMTAIAIDLGLIGLFGLQHSVMARPGFKAMLDDESFRSRSSAASTCSRRASR